MEDPHSTYTYTPLSEAQREIRLLHLLPKHNGHRSSAETKDIDATDCYPADDIIRCTFSLASLNDAPSFEALSYVWGDPKGVTSIDLEGHAFLVTRNLHCALSHLRSDNEERVLWVDALCINQADNEERTSQVAQMQYVYASALTVVVFLGEAWEGMDPAMTFVENIGGDANLHLDPGLDHHVISHSMDIGSETLQNHLAVLFSLPWFSRIWTVQEYALARRVVFQCGQRSLDGMLLDEGVDKFFLHLSTCCQLSLPLIKGKSSDGVGMAEALHVMIYRRYVRNNKRSNVLILMATMFRSHKAYDPRDKIYGLLGLASAGSTASIHPDYSKSTSEVYTNVAMASIHDSHTLDILSFGCGLRVLSFGLPSFVPDWTSILSIPSLLAVQPRYKILFVGVYNASSGSQAELTMVGPGMVRSKGVIVDAVSKILKKKANTEWKEWVNDVRKLAEAENQDTTQALRAPISSRLWHTLCGGVIQDHNGYGRFNWRPVKDLDLVRYQQWQTWIDSPKSPSLMGEAVSHFNSALFTVAIGRKFIVTKKGYIGFGPDACKKGDFVVVLPGGKVPYILRPAPADVQGAYTAGNDANHDPTPRRHYTFLGDAYINGIMNGEAYNEDKLEEIIFV